ncbi:tRNA (N6-threonylcarbamoyladenosine(37)-N6)-methyltransferase TrmO [Neiella sp. HB171785]|uniref:tRNA (N6-threonylcarbamoyladenosine(37)-N6)-methyltransferase TrmO n=1 Tax=Neiella litorisoli TaxID=2771431 RepID=A0A8J6UEZ3_9GAMM|nr:tRNA (N6-threonylcarbamoyladenosine(37)-N6)-methyltransferase TrmO [Neiella litorisoli]MBD1390239.1 tRNA (N6-threonylcarbamoyladenosine(37)-N6)-methyltransferase TrmO [Neiella litorisoli]
MIAIGTIRSPYGEKFAIPRQPGLAPEALGYCDLTGEFGVAETVRGLNQFSHIWLIFQFHQTVAKGWQPLVRPPRLGGNKKVGVFASRSTFRPNGIGMSLVELVDVESLNIDGQPTNRLTLRGLDLVDGTPVLDIKPYLPYAEAITDAKAGYADEKPSGQLAVIWSQAALQGLTNKPSAQLPTLDIKVLIEQVLSQDPRPAYQAGKDSDRIYGVKLASMDVKFHFPAPTVVEVLSLVALC